MSGSSDISVLGPGVYGEGRGGGAANGQGGGKVSEPHTMERMTTDIQSLKMQYERLKQRQQQAHIIIAGEKRFRGFKLEYLTEKRKRRG